MSKEWIVYARTKRGEIKSWQCKVAKSGHTGVITITTKAGEDYKPIVREEIIKAGKNIGRANETTAYEQALSEAASRYEEKLKQGYTTSKPGKSKVSNTNALGFIQPMLAKVFDFKGNYEFPVYMQPKLNGHRALVTVDKNGKYVMYSRRGTLITTMDHILKEISDNMVLIPGQYLDGELYVHGVELQDIASAVKKFDSITSLKVQYHVYDCYASVTATPGVDYSDYTFSNRWNLLVNMMPEDSDIITLVPTYTIKSMDQAIVTLDKFISKGYEGAMVRLDDLPYQHGFRSNSLLKLKKFDDHEYKVIDVIPGKEVTLNGDTVKPGILVCKCPTGLFEVYAPGTMEEKAKILKNKKQYIGKKITVKHFGFTKDKKPWHPVALCFREDI
jgi:DNA ligase-1